MDFREGIHEEIFARARPYLQTRSNEVHTKISHDFVLRLLAEEEGDPEVAIPAILLHDVGWSRVPEERQLSAFGPEVKDPGLRDVHEREGASMAAKILSDLGCSASLCREVAEIIRGHDSRLESISASDALVKDADKLFRFSHAGFRIDCERFGLDPAFHIDWLEARITEWFFTPTARTLACGEVAARRKELNERA